MGIVVWVPDYSGIREVMQSDKVREALHHHAEQILPRAKELAKAAKLPEFAVSLKVEDGTRPKGRPYSRVTADHPDGEKIEWGDTNTNRRRILGQAANIPPGL